MLIVWYCLISFMRLLLNTIEFFFVKLLKFNNSFFNLFFKPIFSIFNVGIEKVVNNNMQYNRLDFKSLYQEYNFFFTLQKFSNLKLFLIKTVFAKYLVNGNYDSRVLLLISLINATNNLQQSKKINTSKIYSNLQIGNFKKRFNLSTLYLLYKVSAQNIKNNFVTINEKIEIKIQNIWNVKYAPSNFIKYITLKNISQYNVLYLRKHKVFNKGRYSRNRQYYRTGVYWCLYVNIIAVIGIYFWFYRFTMNFGYLWWLLCGFILSFIIPKTIKYGLYNPLRLVNSLYQDLIWLSILFTNSYKGLLSLFNRFFILNLSKNRLFKLINSFIDYTKTNIRTYIWEFNLVEYYSSTSNSKVTFLNRLNINLNSFFKFF